MRNFLIGLSIATTIACHLASVAAQPLVSPTARFVFLQIGPDKKERLFIFELTDPARLQEARQIIGDPSNHKRHVQGKVVQRQAAYNPSWSFHLDPATVTFFELQIEVCDANVTYVQDHLDEVGGAFLPKSVWCPWTSTLTKELN